MSEPNTLDVVPQSLEDLKTVSQFGWEIVSQGYGFLIAFANLRRGIDEIKVRLDIYPDLDGNFAAKIDFPRPHRFITVAMDSFQIRLKYSDKGWGLSWEDDDDNRYIIGMGLSRIDKKAVLALTRVLTEYDRTAKIIDRLIELDQQKTGLINQI